MWGSKTPAEQTKQPRCAQWANSTEGVRSSRVICAAWKICPSLSFVFLMQRCVLHGDTHNHYKSRSRMKVECGRKERKHVATESGRVADCKWMAIRAKCNAQDQVYHFPCPFPSNSLSPSHFCPILSHRWVTAGKPFTKASGWFVITREHNSFSPPSSLANSLCKKWHNDK